MRIPSISAGHHIIISKEPALLGKAPHTELGIWDRMNGGSCSAMVCIQVGRVGHRGENTLLASQPRTLRASRETAVVVTLLRGSVGLADCGWIRSMLQVEGKLATCCEYGVVCTLSRVYLTSNGYQW